MIEEIISPASRRNESHTYGCMSWDGSIAYALCIMHWGELTTIPMKQNPIRVSADDVPETGDDDVGGDLPPLRDDDDEDAKDDQGLEEFVEEEESED